MPVIHPQRGEVKSTSSDWTAVVRRMYEVEVRTLSGRHGSDILRDIAPQEADEEEGHASEIPRRVATEVGLSA
jgi:hypothetical protein